MNPVDHVRYVVIQFSNRQTDRQCSLTVVATISISVKPRLSRATLPRARRRVSSRRGERVCCVVPRRSRTEHVALLAGVRSESIGLHRHLLVGHSSSHETCGRQLHAHEKHNGFLCFCITTYRAFGGVTARPDLESAQAAVLEAVEVPVDETSFQQPERRRSLTSARRRSRHSCICDAIEIQ